MRALLLFIARSYYTILFLLLEGYCVYLVVANNGYQNASFVNSSNSVATSVNGTVNEVTEYFNLKDANELLANENAALRAKLKSTFYKQSVSTQSVTDTIRRQQYTYIAAKVVSNTVNRRSNYLTLDKGSIQGIRRDMGVITSNGVVGIVKDVSPHFCTVISTLHKDTRISAKLKKEGFFGSLVWEGGDARYAVLKDIPKHVTLFKNDTLETTSYSPIYPEGVFLGIVENFEVKEGDNFYTIKVVLSTDFQKLSYVYVVNNLMKNEQKAVEQTTENDK